MNLVKNLHSNAKKYIRLYLTGFGMGTADLIPGVSGGTVAFLSGIYEELLYTIKSLSGDFLKIVLKGQIRQAVRIIPFKFLIPLGLGLFSAIFSLANLLSYMLAEHPSFIWAFFFGLVLASTFIVLKRVVRWDLSDRLSFLISAIITYFIVGMIPIETPNNLPFIFISGAIAICAMILPGISGSFILLLLGKYQQILGAVTERDFLTLGVFMAGCVIGLALFARVLSWLFKNHHDISVAILAGVMLGSIRKIWPWQEVVSTRINSHGEVVPLIVNNVLPSAFDLQFLLVATLMVFGAGFVMYLDRYKVTQEHVDDIENKEFTEDYKKALKNQ